MAKIKDVDPAILDGWLMGKIRSYKGETYSTRKEFRIQRNLDRKKAKDVKQTLPEKE